MISYGLVIYIYGLIVVVRSLWYNSKSYDSGKRDAGNHEQCKRRQRLQAADIAPLPYQKIHTITYVRETIRMTSIVYILYVVQSMSIIQVKEQVHCFLHDTKKGTHTPTTEKKEKKSCSTYRFHLRLLPPCPRPPPYPCRDRPCHSMGPSYPWFLLLASGSLMNPTDQLVLQMWYSIFNIQQQRRHKKDICTDTTTQHKKCL